MGATRPSGGRTREGGIEQQMSKELCLDNWPTNKTERAKLDTA